jgi:hypothetical protein
MTIWLFSIWWRAEITTLSRVVSWIIFSFDSFNCVYQRSPVNSLRGGLKIHISPSMAFSGRSHIVHQGNCTYWVFHRNLASRHSSRVMVKWKNLQRTWSTLINISSDNISLIGPPESWGSFFTSSDIKIVGSGIQNSWTKDQLSSISTEMAGRPESITPIS